MKRIIQPLVRYMEAVTGIEPKLKPAPDALQKLPIYMGSLYEVWKGDLLDRHYHLFISKGQKPSTPSEVARHYRVATRELGEPIAFVIEDLESFARRRLLQYRVPFVVPGRQMYLPLILIDLREKARGLIRSNSVQIEHLSGAGQTLLLYYLQKPRTPKLFSLGEWASLLGYSAMTATRIASELTEAQLCKVEQHGRKTLLDFDHDRRAVWEKALPFLRTPIRGLSNVLFAANRKLRWLQAGIPALSHHTMIADDGHIVVAMNNSEYARAIVEGTIEELPFMDENAGTVERWRYRPEILADRPTVDRLSLYLSLREDPDERVQGAREELLEGVRW